MKQGLALLGRLLYFDDTFNNYGNIARQGSHSRGRTGVTAVIAK